MCLEFLSLLSLYFFPSFEGNGVIKSCQLALESGRKSMGVTQIQLFHFYSKKYDFGMLCYLSKKQTNKEIIMFNLWLFVFIIASYQVDICKCLLTLCPDFTVLTLTVWQNVEIITKNVNVCYNLQRSKKKEKCNHTFMR